jgi:hypothetical protein
MGYRLTLSRIGVDPHIEEGFPPLFLFRQFQ